MIANVLVISYVKTRIITNWQKCSILAVALMAMGNRKKSHANQWYVPSTISSRESSWVSGLVTAWVNAVINTFIWGFISIFENLMDAKNSKTTSDQSFQLSCFHDQSHHNKLTNPNHDQRKYNHLMMTLSTWLWRWLLLG